MRKWKWKWSSLDKLFGHCQLRTKPGSYCRAWIVVCLIPAVVCPFRLSLGYIRYSISPVYDMKSLTGVLP